MPINLKQINILDADSIKLDKVNYNFDQLVANGGGPRGRQGSIGQTGPQGTTGQQGFQGVVGDAGNQGPQGIISPNYWNKIVAGPIDAETIMPRFYTNNPPVVNIGYLESESTYYNKAQPLVNGKNPFQWNIHRQNYSRSNLRFSNVDGNMHVDWRLEKLDDLDQMTLGFLEDLQNSTSVYQTGQMSFQGTTPTLNSFIIDESRALFVSETTFNLPVNIKQNLNIRSAAGALDKVATCMNDAGLLNFKTVAQLPGTVPFGTIVSIMPSIFNNNSNFINTENVSINNSLDINKPLKISVGKGIGTYTGWYLCNGETWTNGTFTQPVPMLGNFNYEIDDNELSESPNGQGTVEFDPINATHITGGSDINMTATPSQSSQLVYNITSTVSMSSVQVNPGTGTTFKIKQLPQIIYLGSNNLYWSNKGTGQAEPVPLTWILDDQNTTASKLSPDPYPLGVTDDRSAGQSYSEQFLVTAPLGYYWSTLPTAGNISGLPGYATISGISFADSSNFPTAIRLNIGVNSHPATSGTITLGINTSSFISPAIANITLNTFDITNVTSNISTVFPIPSYNFVTGFDFIVIHTAAAGYVFPNIPPVRYYIYNQSFTNEVPPPGGGNITILNSTRSSDGKVLEMNVRLSDIPTTGYLTNQNYILGLAPIIAEPVILVETDPFYYKFRGSLTEDDYGFKVTNTGTYSVAQNEINIRIKNQTGSPVFIWCGIEQLFAGGGTSNLINAGFKNTVAGYNYSKSCPAYPTQSITAFTDNSRQVDNGSIITTTLYVFPTTDQRHRVRLYWSSASNSPVNERYPIKYELQ